MRRFRIYANIEGTWARVGRAVTHLDKALSRLAALGAAEIRETLPSGREVLFAVKLTPTTALTVNGNTLHLPKL